MQKYKKILSIMLLTCLTICNLTCCTHENNEKEPEPVNENVNVKVHKKESPKSKYKLYKDGLELSEVVLGRQEENYDISDNSDGYECTSKLQTILSNVIVPSNYKVRGTYYDYIGEKHNIEENYIYELKNNEQSNCLINELSSYNNEDFITYKIESNNNYIDVLEEYKKKTNDYLEIKELNDTLSLAFICKEKSTGYYHFCMSIDEKTSMHCLTNGFWDSEQKLNTTELGYAIYDTITLINPDTITCNDDYTKEDLAPIEFSKPDYSSIDKDDIEDGYFILNDDYYHLNCTVKELETSGYKLEPYKRFWDMTSTEENYLEYAADFVDDYGNYAFSVILYNDTGKTVKYTDSKIKAITVYNDENKVSDVNIKFPDDINLYSSIEFLKGYQNDDDYFFEIKDNVIYLTDDDNEKDEAKLHIVFDDTKIISICYKKDIY